MRYRYNFICNIAKKISYFTVQIGQCLNFGGHVVQRDWFNPGRGQVLLRSRDCSSPPDPSVAFFLTSPLSENEQMDNKISLCAAACTTILIVVWAARV